MGLDIYVGPLTRYYAGQWKNVVQQAAEATGAEYRVIRTEGEHADAVKDPAVIQTAVTNWQKGISGAVGVPFEWQESIDLPYWTDKPDWDGFGAVVLLAAEITCRGSFDASSSTLGSDPRSYAENSVYLEAVQKAETYPSLLLNVEWWLPYSGGPSVFGAPDVAGNVRRMSRVESLRQELEVLNQETLKLDEHAVVAVRTAGPPNAGASVKEAAPFGLAVMLRLVREAATNMQPLILDY